MTPEEYGQRLENSRARVAALEETTDALATKLQEADDAVEDLRKQRDALVRQLSELREAALNLSIADQRYRSPTNERMELVDAWVKLNHALRASNPTSPLKPKCVCGGVGLGVACEAGCPNYALKRNNEGDAK